MTDVAWSIKIGTVAAPTDFSTVCAGVQVTQRAPFMDHTSGDAFITLNNSDGALTPGGGGAYANVDWFRQGVFISATVGAVTAQVFHGIIDDFTVDDDGTNSTVTITASDWFSVFGRAITEYDVSTTNEPWFEHLQVVCSEAVYGSQRMLPDLGQNVGRPEYDALSFGTRTFDPALAGSNLEWDVTLDAGQAFADVLHPGYLAAVPSAIWATTIESDSGDCVYHMGLIGDELTRSDSAATTFTFADSTGSGLLPVGELETGYNTDTLVNHIRATVTWTSGGSTNTSIINRADQTSIEQYGRRSLLNDAAGYYQGNTGGFMQATLQNLVGRMSGITYEPKRLTFTAAMVTDAGSSPTYLGWLLDVTRGIWQACKIVYTPTGAAQRTTGSVIVGRTITATPADTTITLDLLPAANFQSLKLDDTTLGVLDTDRLG